LRPNHDRLEFVKVATQISEELRREIGGLFTDRNRLVHASEGKVQPFEGGTLGVEAVQALNLAGRGEELDEAIERFFKGDERPLRELADDAGEHHTTLTLPSISTEVLEKAPESFATAKKALKALREEWESCKRDMSG